MRLGMCTGYYMEELFDWVNHNNYGSLIEESGMLDDNYYVEINCDDKIIKNIFELLQEIILNQNTVTKSCPNLKSSLKEIVFNPYEDEITKIINDFLDTNSQINLEGFVHFRLNEYIHLVNLVLYQAIKRALR